MQLLNATRVTLLSSELLSCLEDGSLRTAHLQALEKCDARGSHHSLTSEDVATEVHIAEHTQGVLGHSHTGSVVVTVSLLFFSDAECERGFVRASRTDGAQRLMVDARTHQSTVPSSTTGSCAHWRRLEKAALHIALVEIDKMSTVRWCSLRCSAGFHFLGSRLCPWEAHGLELVSSMMRHGFLPLVTLPKGFVFFAWSAHEATVERRDRWLERMGLLTSIAVPKCGAKLRV